MSEAVLKELGIAYERRADGTLFVPEDIDLSEKNLTALPDLSTVHVGGHFSCSLNLLINLAGSPHTVGGHFFCNHNKLTSLAGAPQSIGADFWCRNNKLTNLEHAPQNFKNLLSDLGEFTSWANVPEELRISPETRERLAKEAFEHKVRTSTVTQKPVRLISKIRPNR